MPEHFGTQHNAELALDRAATNSRRRALQVVFFLLGVSLASWVVRTPAIRDALAASTGQMGLVLFGLSAGSMTGIVSSGLLVRRLGTKPVIAVSTFLAIAGISVLGAATALAMTPLAFTGLLLFGLGMGCSEIAVNIDGADVERLERRPLMPLLHGTFSAGTVAGSVLGLALTRAGVGVVWHLLGVALAATVAAAMVLPAIPAGLGVKRGTSKRGFSASVRQQLDVWAQRRIVLIGCVVLGMALAEGAANDWLPLLMVDEHGYDPTSGSLVYTVFAVAMTTGRLLGTGLVHRFGRTAVVRTSALCAALGVGLVIFTADPVIAVAGVLLWGLGGSLGFPLAISAAGDGGGDSASRVSAVATAGYLAFLVGPPLLGFLGDHFGLRHAMIVVLVLAGCAAATASAVRPQPRREVDL
ncbi:Fucose permease [Saccharopolyspora antimicrobica]|uniref:Fucose permease n=1 Tax=Saccharopolyspora antimicrobica TaxID=455193 RepID=A0A1I4W1Z8_9PSEU|nr:MFS transporter [Saccharopolyspora antimicrobica]RKT87102.1 fucose permease [Saccharopolyspora antimicrobica]SFN07604.1 Fucose permease [Saccharopolyspora antimicrobica]